MIGGAQRDRWNRQSRFRTYVDVVINFRRRNAEIGLKILADSNDDYPLASLWNAVLVKRVKVRDDPIARAIVGRLKVLQNLFESLALVRSAKS
ncbi:hypothetical protein ARTHRO8AJ_460079 [Arthrobacter sp. 8AJ]|nr:hypothetical protein ARTHRO8AJ_460079 [Arthrobacter sp. 8AJ]